MFNNKLIILIGRSGSGKSTIESELIKYGFKKIISHTSREIRDDDLIGESYHFVDKEFFENEINLGNFLEYAIYNGNYYGVHKTSIKEGENYVAVVNPNGFRSLTKLFPNNISFYIKVNEKTMLLRALNREECPNCKIICQRFLSDEIEFSNIENEVDYVIFNNDNINETVNIILKNIKDF